MKAWGALGLISLGGLTETLIRIDKHDWPVWTLLLAVSVCGWGWSVLYTGIQAARDGVLGAAGRRPVLPATDPRALAEEINALNAQIAQLRDTATSFDVSFDQTLQRLDERLRRIEQQTPYVHAGRGH